MECKQCSPYPLQPQPWNTMDNKHWWHMVAHSPKGTAWLKQNSSIQAAHFMASPPPLPTESKFFNDSGSANCSSWFLTLVSLLNCERSKWCILVAHRSLQAELSLRFSFEGRWNTIITIYLYCYACGKFRKGSSMTSPVHYMVRIPLMSDLVYIVIFWHSLRYFLLHHPWRYPLSGRQRSIWSNQGINE